MSLSGVRLCSAAQALPTAPQVDQGSFLGQACVCAWLLVQPQAALTDLAVAVRRAFSGLMMGGVPWQG